MAAGLIVPISGPYIGTYNGSVMGTMDDNGFTLSCTWHGQEMNASDAYGMTLVNAIYRGMNWRLSFNSLEFNSGGLTNIIKRFGWLPSSIPTPNDQTLSPILTGVGTTWVISTSASLVLTAILSNPPTRPQTLTASNAYIAPETNVQMLMTSKMRETPIEMVLLPYASTIDGVGYNLSFTTT